MALVGDEDADLPAAAICTSSAGCNNMPEWRATPVAEQEQAIGRSKQDGWEMDDEVKPPTAHIARVVIPRRTV